MKFSDLNLHTQMMQGVQDLGFEDCTPIQEQSFEHLVQGRDVSGLAQTGTGKTAAFLVPLIERYLRSEEDPTHTRAFQDYKSNQFTLVLVPTRELAHQVFDNFKQLAQHTPFKASVVYGGTSYEGQVKSIREGVKFIVATPGRLIDLYKEHVVDLAQVNAMVFDEADRMFDMGFKDDMRYILQRVPKSRQIVVISATLDFEVLNTIYAFGSHPVEINVSEDGTKAENVEDKILHVGQQEKPQFLLSLLKRFQPQQAIVFSNFKRNVERLAPFLTANGFPAEGISSLLTQHQRNTIMKKFKAENNLNILVATDVAARGLDIKNVDLVLNFELPEDAANYIHRIGRTGRAGEKGKAFSLVCEKDVEALERIQSYLDHKLDVFWLEDGEIIEDFEPMMHESPAKRISHNYAERKKSKLSRGGGRPTSSRGGEKGGGKSRPYSRKAKRKDASGSSVSQESSSSPTHRDRLTGRHGGGKKSSTSTSSSTSPSEKSYSGSVKKSSPHKKKKYNKRRRRSSGGASAKPSMGSQPSAQAQSSGASSATVGQKIKGLFKKIWS